MLVFGATGALDCHMPDALVTRGISPETITAVGRNRVRLGELASAGFGTAAVDLSDAAAVAELVAGHSDNVLISGTDPNRLAQHKSVIEAAKNAHARHVYYTGGARADDDRFGINADHRATEITRAASGVTGRATAATRGTPG
ncbi:NAD(P)H-binding protein [Streptomyces sp. NPDC058762]|uniref:NAD(P)H-binding protein n=1 Tax=Streptomyces sp. NPDC058762 TaxID=3346629 RepID=UPI0036B5AB2A